MKYFIIISMFFFSCSTSRKDSFGYPLFVKENHLESYYNEAKWELYKSYFNCFSKDSLFELFSSDFRLVGYDTIDYWFENNLPTNSPGFGDSEKCIFYTFDVPFEFNFGDIGCNIYRLGFINDSIRIVEEKYDYGVFNFDKKQARDSEFFFKKEMKKNEINLTPWLLAIAKKKGVVE